MRNKNLNHKNNLLQARRRANLEPKQVAFLLSKKSTDELYRYEKGNGFPNLPTALKLEIVYQTPVRLLFEDLYAELAADVAGRRKTHPYLFPEKTRFPSRTEQIGQEESCFYAEILKTRFPGPAETAMITKHIIALTNTLSDYKQGRNPFSLPVL